MSNRQLRLSLLSILPFLLMAAAWQIASMLLPPFLFPPIPGIVLRVIEIFLDWQRLSEVLATVARILAGLIGAFVLGGVLAVLMARMSSLERMIGPPLGFLQGIPALSWVVFAIIWFHGVEVRIFFIILLTSLPGFTFQLLDAVRAISRDLTELVLVFRPRRMQMIRVLIWPALVPGILTAWKVNLGNAARVVVVAELVGASGGVGYELLQQQQMFDMTGAMAWTLQLVFFVLIMQWLLGVVDARALRYRATTERAL